MCKIIVAGIVLVLAACQTGGGVKETRYPAEIRGIEDSPNYPLVAAGFNRAEIMSFAPGMTDISTAYNLLTPEVQIAATIYRSSKNGRAPNLSDQYLAEKHNIEKYHSGAELISEEDISLEKNGNTYSAKRASYRFGGKFMHKQQVVYSELVLLSHGDKYIKLRSTAPIAQKEKARDKNMELLNVVDWAN
jgi:hypothetical protein